MGRNRKDTKRRGEDKERVRNLNRQKIEGERKRRGGAKEAKRKGRKAEDDCYSSINAGT